MVVGGTPLQLSQLQVKVGFASKSETFAVIIVLVWTQTLAGEAVKFEMLGTAFTLTTNEFVAWQPLASVIVRVTFLTPVELQLTVVAAVDVLPAFAPAPKFQV
jgi:hypothetical protein